jgi:hypothetical protein
MRLGWQDALVALIVVSALGWLVRRRLRARRNPGPACEDCPAAVPSGIHPPAPRVREVLYSIETAKPPKPRT